MRSRGSHEAVDIRTFLLAHPSSSDPYVRLSTLNSGPPKKQSVWPATADLRRSGRGLGTTGKKRTNPRRLARLHRHVGRFACPARQAPGSISAWRQCSADGLALARLTRRRRERTPPCDVVARQTVRFCEAFRPRGSCWVGTGLVAMMLLARLLRLLDYMSRGSAITSSS
jgi:hypothetical protein